MEIIQEALANMDPDNDAEWTESGLPKVEVIKTLSGISEITRDMITETDAEFTRDKARTLKGSDRPTGDPTPSPNEPDASVMTDGPAWLSVKIVDPEILGMPSNAVLSNIELTERALDEFTQQFNELVSRRDSINKKIAELSTRSTQMSVMLARSSTSVDKQNKLTSGIRAYIQKGQEEKRKKIKKAQAFIQGGTTVKDIKQALTIQAPIDLAYSQRRRHGVGRPTPFLNPQRNS